MRFFRLDAKRCITLFNRSKIRGMRIYASMAKTKKQAQNYRRDQRRGTAKGVGVIME